MTGCKLLGIMAFHNEPAVMQAHADAPPMHDAPPPPATEITPQTADLPHNHALLPETPSPQTFRQQ